MRSAVCLVLLLPVAVRPSCEEDGPAVGQGPCVDRIQPTTGSLAGGTLLYVMGTNLLPESPNPTVAAATVTIGGTECDIERSLSTSVRLACRTRPYSGFPLGALEGAVYGVPRWADRGCDSGQQHVAVSVLGMGGLIMASWNGASRYCLRGNGHRYCAFTWAWQSTPHVLSVSPRAAPPGSLVTVTGAVCAGDVYNGDTGERDESALKRFERVLIGAWPCELSPASCDTATTSQCPTMCASRVQPRVVEPPWTSM